MVLAPRNSNKLAYTGPWSTNRPGTTEIDRKKTLGNCKSAILAPYKIWRRMKN